MATKLKTETFIKSCVAIASDILKLPLEPILSDELEKSYLITEHIQQVQFLLIPKDYIGDNFFLYLLGHYPYNYVLYNHS